MPWLATEGSPVLPLLFALAFLWLSLAIGRRILIVVGAARQGSLAERGVMAMGLGAGALQFVPFALGAVGALGVTSVRIAAGVVALASARDLWAVALAARRAIERRTRPEPWVIAWALALSPALLVAALTTLVPTIDPDGLGYHLTVPKRWLHSGSLGYLPTYPYSNAPMGVEMLFTLGLALGGDSAAKCVHFVLGTVGVFGLFFAGKRLKSPMVGAVSATLFLVGPVGVTVVLGSAYVEGAAACAMIGSALAWLLWFQTRAHANLRIAGLLAGFAVCFKITAALLPVALVALTFVAALDPLASPTPAAPLASAGATDEGKAGRSRQLVRAVGFSARLIPFVVAPMLPWMTRAAILTGNPLYPLLARWIPSRDLSPDLSAKFDKWNRYMTWGNILGRGWGIDQRAHVLAAVCGAIFVLGALAFVRARSRMSRGTTAVVVLIILAQVSAAGLYVRYSIPLAAVVTLPIAAALASLFSRRLAPAVCVALTLVASIVQVRRTLAQIDSDARGLVLTALGIEDRHEFLVKHLASFPLWEEVNRETPQDARVMLSCSCGGFYIDRTTYCADMVQDSLRFTTWDDFTTDLRRLGITHVIAPTLLAQESGPWPPFDLSSTSSITREAQYRFVRPLLSAHGKERGVAFDQGLYELDGAVVGAR